jgi:hypothetical protein
MIQATYIITEAEYIEAQMLIARLRDPKRFRNRLIGLIVTATASFLLLLGALFDISAAVRAHHFPSPFAMAMGLIFGIAFLYILFDLITLHSIKKRLKTIYSRINMGRPPGHTTIDETGWRDETPGTSNTFVEWTGFCHRIETDTLFIAMRPQLMFNLIPKRVLSPEDTASFRTLIETRVPQAPPDTLSL